MTQSNNPQDAEMTAEWYAELAEKQLQELLDMEAKMGSEMRSMKKRGMDLMDEEEDMGDEEAVEPAEEELSEETTGEEEDEEVVEPTEEELAAKKRPMRKKGMNKPMPKRPMMDKKPMDKAPMAEGVKPLSRDELMEKLFGKRNTAKAGVQSPKAPNPSQGKGKK
jgi:hypothetical protein